MKLIRMLYGNLKMKTSEFDYNLPQSFIAQTPLTPRDSSRLLVFDTSRNKVSNKRFHEIEKLLKDGDILVVNVSKVIPARIIFKEKKSTREIFLLKKLGKTNYQALVKPGRKFKKDSKFKINKNLSCVVKEVLGDGTRIFEFSLANKKLELAHELDKAGQAPFPPYIKNTKASFSEYQTVYAKEKGSVASPTAGLHFTKRLIRRLKAKGVNIVEVVLHVGLGTFLPVTTENIEDHLMHSEYFEISPKTVNILNKAKKEHRRIIAVGTTSVRVLESSYNRKKGFLSKSCETDIFIYPGYKWRAVDALITNFHLPKSTLLMLVSSFIQNKGIKNSTEKLFDLYNSAKRNRYRFYSFGDSMFLY